MSLSTLYKVEHPSDGTTRLQTLERLAYGLGVHPYALLSADKQILEAPQNYDVAKLVGLNIKRTRKEQAATQEALASRAQVARHLIAKIEAGSHENPTLGLLDRLATALGVHLEELLLEPAEEQQKCL